MVVFIFHVLSSRAFLDNITPPRQRKRMKSQAFVRRLFYISGLLFMLSSCQQHAGLYSPSFDGIQTVYDKGQTLHAISMGPSIGKYFNYSPVKNLAFFADARYNVNLPQISMAIGGYSSHYTSRTFETRSGKLEKYDVGFHFDSYLGFGYHGGHEYLINPEVVTLPVFENSRDELTYHSFRTYWQTGAHLKARKFKFDMVYRLNYLDIEKLVFSPRSEYFISHVAYIANNNPYIVNELQFMVGLGSRNLRTNVGLNIAFTGEHATYIDYSKFSMVNIGFSYIFD